MYSHTAAQCVKEAASEGFFGTRDEVLYVLYIIQCRDSKGAVSPFQRAEGTSGLP